MTVLKKTSSNGLDIGTVDLIGPEGANPRVRHAGSDVARGRPNLVFQARGTCGCRGAQKANFDVFIKSLKPADAHGQPAQAPAA